MVRLRSQVIKGDNADIKLSYQMLIWADAAASALTVTEGTSQNKNRAQPFGVPLWQLRHILHLIGHSLRGQDQVQTGLNHIIRDPAHVQGPGGLPLYKPLCLCLLHL